MTSNLDKTDASTGDRTIARAYHREFWPGMIGYAVVLTAVLLWGDLDGESPWRFVWAILPVVPLLWVVVAILRHIRRIDDYQRFLLLQGLAVGFCVAMLAAVTVAFLEIAGLGLTGDGWIIYGAGMLGWLVTSTVSRAR
ncbi:hypothetical protein [Glaciihabitans tibetensis]|nr:hypothetical protein [Glaciihabitans tibetensis]